MKVVFVNKTFAHIAADSLLGNHYEQEDEKDLSYYDRSYMVGDVNGVDIMWYSHQWTNHDVWWSVDTNTGVVEIEGQRHALLEDFTTYEDYTPLLWVAREMGLEPVEYSTSDKRLKYWETLVSYIEHRGTVHEKLGYMEDWDYQRGISPHVWDNLPRQLLEDYESYKTLTDKGRYASFTPEEMQVLRRMHLIELEYEDIGYRRWRHRI